jgi:hypothetical protein
MEWLMTSLAIPKFLLPKWRKGDAKYILAALTSMLFACTLEQKPIRSAESNTTNTTVAMQTNTAFPSSTPKPNSD